MTINTGTTRLPTTSALTSDAAAPVVPTFSLDAIRSALTDISPEIASFVNPVTAADTATGSALGPHDAQECHTASGLHLEPLSTH